MPALSSVAMASGGIVVLENRRGSAQTSGAVPRPSSHRARRCNQGHVRQAGGNSRLKLRRRQCGLGGKLSGVRARRRTRSTAWRIVLRPERHSPAPSGRRSEPLTSRLRQTNGAAVFVVCGGEVPDCLRQLLGTAKARAGQRSGLQIRRQIFPRAHNFGGPAMLIGAIFKHDQSSNIFWHL